MKKKEIQTKIDEGHLHVNVIFEIVGKPKSHIEQTMKAYVENIKTNEEIIVINEDYEPASELEEGIFSTIAEIEMLVKNLEKLTWLCLNFTPASIEVLAPDEKTMAQRDITNWMNDLLSRLHEIGMVQKNLQGQHQALVKNFNAMTRNAMLLALQHTNEIDQISKKIGMDAKHSKQFMEALIKEGKVREEKDKYYLKNG